MATSIWHRLRGRGNAVWIACCLAGTSQIAIVALLIGIVTKDTSLNSTLEGIAWAAAIAHIIALIVLPATAFLSLRRTTGSTQIVLGALSILLAVLAAILSIYVFSQVWEGLNQVEDRDAFDVATVRNLTQAGLAVWAIAIVAQVALYALLFWPTNEHKDNDLSTEEGTVRSSPARSIKQTISVQLAALSPPSTPRFIRPSESGSPSAARQRSDSAASIRDSVDKMIRPMTSKTKLLLQKAQSLNSDRKTSLDTIGQEDDFGDWDTTSPNDVAPMPQEPYVRPSTRARLETIPGSRPVSPAKPLDGPFHGESEDDERPVTALDARFSESTARPVYSSPNSDDADSIRLSTRSSRAASVADDQRKIHPLFRSESPAPAPAIRSPNTNVYAHPQGGRLVLSDDDIENLGLPRNLHSSHSHRAESPNAMSPARSRQSSFRSQTSPIEPFGLARPSPAFAVWPEPKG